AALAFGCGSEKKAEAPAAPAAAPAPAPSAAPAPAPAPARAPAAPAAMAPEAAPEEAAAPSGEYPPDFPSDVPRYPGSTVSASRRSEDGAFSVTIYTRDSVVVVSKYFGDGLTASGWQTVVQAMPEGTMIIAEKDGGRAQALIHDGDQGALIELIVGRPPPE